MSKINLHISTREEFSDFATKLHDAQYPIAGELALALWEWSNDQNTCPALAMQVMTQLGYQPFSGYPLRRINKNERPRQ